MKRDTKSARKRRARGAARTILTLPARNGSLASQVPVSASLAAMAKWENPDLSDLALKAPTNRGAWDACAEALLDRHPAEPGMDKVRQLAARFMRGLIKRPKEKRKHLNRDMYIVMAVRSAVTEAQPGDDALAIACEAVAGVLNELEVRPGRGLKFTDAAIRAIWMRRPRLPPERLRIKTRTE